MKSPFLFHVVQIVKKIPAVRFHFPFGFASCIFTSLTPGGLHQEERCVVQRTGAYDQDQEKSRNSVPLRFRLPVPHRNLPPPKAAERRLAVKRSSVSPSYMVVGVQLGVLQGTYPEFPGCFLYRVPAVPGISAAEITQYFRVPRVSIAGPSKYEGGTCVSDRRKQSAFKGVPNASNNKIIDPTGNLGHRMEAVARIPEYYSTRSNPCYMYTL